jgi:hypothetical protein
MTRDRAVPNARNGTRPQAEVSRSDGPGEPDATTPEGSVTGDVADLRATDPRIRDEAARRIWERFAPRLRALAAAQRPGAEPTQLPDPGAGGRE